MTAPRSRTRTSRPLARDRRLLTRLLAGVLDRFAGEGLRERWARVGGLAGRRRRGDAGAEAELRRVFDALPEAELEELARTAAFTFDLFNLAEERQRLRVLTGSRRRGRRPAPYPDSVAAAFAGMAAAGVPAERAAALWSGLEVEPVFTAHPTESKRRVVRRGLRRVREHLAALDDPADPADRRERLGRITADLGALWQTDSFRDRKPTVMEEAARAMSAFDALWTAVPELTVEARRGFTAAYGRPADAIACPLRFGSWIGGDRDGNPFVTSEVTEAALRQLRSDAILRHRRVCDDLDLVLTMSAERQDVPGPLRGALDAALDRFPGLAERRPPEVEAHRSFLRVIRTRLERSDRVESGGPPVEAAYPDAAAFRADVNLLADSLLEAGHRELVEGTLLPWLDRIDAFGLHLARLDFREHADRLHAAAEGVAAALGIDLPPREEAEALATAFLQPLPPEVGTRLRGAELPEVAAETLDTFRLLERVARSWGPACLGPRITSMTRTAADALVTLWLARAAAAAEGHGSPAAPPPVAPLFETIADLRAGAEVMRWLYAQPAYQEHLKASGGAQVVMIGYSDSAKDGGYLSSNRGLYAAQQELAAVADAAGVPLHVFHGRGGSLGRGGGPAARAIRALPSAAVAGTLRTTEQGEVLSERYDDAEIAQRHLEQVTNATLEVTTAGDPELPGAWTALVDRAAEVSMRTYRGLVEHPGFLSYFGHATPIEAIERLPIGSRPSRRAGERKLENLRAIPYTFAWTQARCPVTAFFGLGAGLATAAEEADGGEALLRDMYEGWPWFHTLIHNVELALVKANADAIGWYAELVPDADGRAVAEVLRSDMARTREMVLRTIGHDDLLEGAAWLRASVEERNPYVDVLNLIQVELLRRRAAIDPADEAALAVTDHALRQTVQGLAAGLRGTG